VKRARQPFVAQIARRRGRSGRRLMSGRLIGLDPETPFVSMFAIPVFAVLMRRRHVRKRYLPPR
jgi:hypothetical protein